VPKSVVVASATVLLLLCSDMLVILRRGVVEGRDFVQLGLSVLILFGLIQGRRLAWQWGRIVPLLVGGCVALVVVMQLATGQASPVAVAYPVFGVLLPLVVLRFALGQASAFQHFRLVCPLCQKPTHKAADGLFNQAKCTACNYVW
jgi:hypothetical protein